MNHLAAFVSFSLVAALGAAGCGSSSSASCTSTFTPCGGSLVGTWAYQTSCGINAIETMQCPGASIDVQSNISGTWTYNADGTFATDLAVEETGTETIPLSCLAGITDCTQLDKSGSFSGLDISLSGCTGTASQSCTCTVSETGTLAEAGTYVTVGNNVSLTYSGSQTGTPTPYCVSGSVLLFGSPTSPSTYAIFTKQ